MLRVFSSGLTHSAFARWRSKQRITISKACSFGTLFSAPGQLWRWLVVMLLGITALKNDFRRSLDEEFDNKGIPRLDFGSGLWQHINSTVKNHRNTFAHSGVKLSDRFPQPPIAEDAIAKIREAIDDIYARLRKQPPPWVDFDQSEGWPGRGGVIGTAHLTVSHAGVTPNTPDVINIVLVTPQGEEKPTRYLPPSASDDEIFWWVEDYLGKLNTPFQAIRVYRGEALIHEETFEAR